MKKTYVEKIIPYVPGKPIEEVQRELGLKRIIKLASNENPLGPSRKAVEAARAAAAEMHLYPDGGSYELRHALEKRLGIPGRQIILGNGSNEIIEFLIRGFVREGEKVLSSQQSFLVYPIATQAAGGQFVQTPVKNLGFDLEALAKAVDEKTRVIFIANPNNPTGTYVNKSELDRFLAAVPERVLVCLDEAYFDFVEAADFPDGMDYVKAGRPNVVVLRTFSKSYGLAGLRLGYGAGSTDVIQYLEKIRQPFNVNLIAQKAGAAALGDEEHLQKTRQVVSEGRKFLYQALGKLGLSYQESQANFVLVDTGRDADEVFQALLRKGVIVRSMKAYGFTRSIRITVGLPEENEILGRELSAVLAKTGSAQ